MANSFLDELEIPRPPYRMARPVASLTASDEPPKPSQEVPPPHRADVMSDDALKKEFEKALPDIEIQLDSLEAVDASVSEARVSAENKIDAVPTPDVAAKESAKQEVAVVEAEYKTSTVPREGRTPAQASAEFKGEGKPLRSIEDEYESTEAALRRAEAAGNKREVDRLTKQSQEYSDVIEKRAAGPVAPPAVTEASPPVKTEAASRLDVAKQAEELAAARVRAEYEKVKASGSADTSPGLREAQEALRARGKELKAELDGPTVPAKEVGTERVNMPVPPEILAMRPPVVEVAPSRTEVPPTSPETAMPTERVRTPEVRRAARPQEKGNIGAAVEWALGTPPGTEEWLDTLMPRLKSVYHRQFAEMRAWMQEKAMGSLDRAVSKRDEYAAKRAEAGWPMKKFYAWRERAWSKTVSKREAIVNKHDLYRTRRIDRHNELQRQVSARYERGLAPYRGIKENLEREQKSVIRVIATLEERYQTTLKALEVAEAKRSGFLGRRGKAAADRIRKCAKETEERINIQRTLLDRVNKPLADAMAKVEEYEARQRGIAEGMKFPEMEGLKAVRRAKPGALPGRRAFTQYTSEGAPEAPAAERSERSGEEWTAGEFAQQWNDNGLVRIDDAAQFEKFVAGQRAAAGEPGPVNLGQMLNLAEAYLKSVVSAREFAKDKQYFLGNVQKPSTPTPA